MHSSTNLEHSAQSIAPYSSENPARHSRYRRENVLMWCIGTVFGAAMITLLVAMCLAEISIHRTLPAAPVSPTAEPAVAVTASR
jgi:hypothetical protein